jgi:FkbM family methyltransferase
VTSVHPLRLVQTARRIRRLLADAPVPAGWRQDAVATQLRLEAGRVEREDGHVRVPVGRFDAAGFSAQSLAYLHNEIFVKLAYYFHAARPDPFVVDGGSNVGISVLFFKALYPDARVLAFEPARRAHALLVRNVERNDLHDVEVHRAALGRADANVPFFEDEDDPATFRMSTRRGRLPGTETTVQQRRLSALVSEDVDLLKLDVEGAEEDVVDELVESGAIARVDQLIAEYHHHLDPGRDFLGRFLERLREQGFACQLTARQPIGTRVAREPTFQDVLVHAFRSRGHT